jgi:hypothetical protein
VAKDNRPNGDKAVYQAITGATKYAVRSCFCLPSEDDPERTLHKAAVKPTGNLISNYNKVETALIAQTTGELKRLGWSSNQGRLYLQEKFGESSRQQLTQLELQHFLNYLRSLPISEENQPVLQLC